MMIYIMNAQPTGSIMKSNNLDEIGSIFLNSFHVRYTCCLSFLKVDTEIPHAFSNRTSLAEYA